MPLTPQNAHDWREIYYFGSLIAASYVICALIRGLFRFWVVGRGRVRPRGRTGLIYRLLRAVGEFDGEVMERTEKVVRQAEYTVMNITALVASLLFPLRPSAAGAQLAAQCEALGRLRGYIAIRRAGSVGGFAATTTDLKRSLSPDRKQDFGSILPYIVVSCLWLRVRPLISLMPKAQAWPQPIPALLTRSSARGIARVGAAAPIVCDTNFFLGEKAVAGAQARLARFSRCATELSRAVAVLHCTVTNRTVVDLSPPWRHDIEPAPWGLLYKRGRGEFRVSCTSYPNGHAPRVAQTVAAITGAQN